MEYKNKRRLIVGISLFLLLVLYLFKNFSTNIRLLSFIFALVIFYFIDYMFKIKFKLRHYYAMTLILIVSWLLSPLYFQVPIYDKILHFILPIIGCFLFFYIIDKEKINLQWKLLITFLFILSFITIHEIGEYIIDVLWDWKLQGVYIGDMKNLNLVMSKIDDTMMDLILGVVGGLVFVFGKAIKQIYIDKLKK